MTVRPLLANIALLSAALLIVAAVSSRASATPLLSAAIVLGVVGLVAGRMAPARGRFDDDPAAVIDLRTPDQVAAGRRGPDGN